MNLHRLPTLSSSPSVKPAPGMCRRARKSDRRRTRLGTVQRGYIPVRTCISPLSTTPSPRPSRRPWLCLRSHRRRLGTPRCLASRRRTRQWKERSWKRAGIHILALIPVRLCVTGVSCELWESSTMLDCSCTRTFEREFRVTCDFSPAMDRCSAKTIANKMNDMTLLEVATLLSRLPSIANGILRPLVASGRRTCTLCGGAFRCA